MPRSAATADEYDIIDHEDTHLDEQDVAKIRAWLQPTDYLAESSEFRRHLGSRAPDTGLWLTKTKEYRQWHDDPDTGSLWIKGIPGSGKSVLAASMIQHLKSTESVPVLFFFFRNIVAANFEPRSLIQDWLAQLLPHSPRLQFALKARLETNLDEISETELVEMLLQGLSGMSHVYCVADALDEMTAENRQFLDRLNSLATWRPWSVKLLMTSRPKQYLQSALRDSSIVQISLEQQLVDPEIATYLAHRFDSMPNVDMPQASRDELITMIAGRSRGLFLYAKLTLDQLQKLMHSTDAIDVDRMASLLPAGLAQTYNSMLAVQRASENIPISLQIMVLEAVTCASRPLRLNELASLVQSVQPDAAESGQFKKLVATSCGSLVEILEDETLQVIHHSFTEFLRDAERTTSQDTGGDEFPVINTLQAHKHMAVYCMRYLRSGTLLLEDEIATEHCQDLSSAFVQPPHLVDSDQRRRTTPKTRSFDFQQAKLKHAFLEYAVTNVDYHVSRCGSQDGGFFHEIKSFVNPDRLDYHRWLARAWGSTTTTRDTLEGLPGILHFSSYCGLSDLVREILDEGHSPDQRDSQLRTSLHWASRKGHASVVKILLQRGADMNAEDGRGLKPLHLASIHNHGSVITLLLEAGVDPLTPKTRENHAGRLLGGETITRGEEAIFYVSKGGNLEATEAMIPFCHGEVLERLLCECCRSSRTDQVLSILDKTQVSADAVYRGATALFHACAAANLKCVQALIKRGASVNKMSCYEPRRNRTGPGLYKDVETAPLHALVRRWTSDKSSQSKAVLRALVEAGVDLEQRNGRGVTALLLAAGDPHGWRQLRTDAIKALLQVGADPHQTDKDGETTLLRTFNTDLDLEAVRCLVEAGSEPNKRGANGDTALHKALSRTSSVDGTENIEATVKYLLDMGADPTVEDNRGKTPIEIAARVDFGIFKSLMSYCSDDNVKRRCWFSMDTYAKSETLGPMVDFLLAEGVDVDCRGTRTGRTLLLSNPMRKDLVEILRERGARLDAVDNDGKNILHLLAGDFVKGATREYMERYIADGMDPLQTDSKGRTLLHHVAQWYRGGRDEAEFVQWLVELGVPANSYAVTPLHVYIEPRCKNSWESETTGGPPTFIEALTSRAKDLDIDARDSHGLTPLHLAVTHSHLEASRLIVAGADLFAVDNKQRNVLHLACRAREDNIVGHLVTLTGKRLLDAQDSDGLTPLHYACIGGRLEAVSYLLRGGADASIRSPSGQTALHFCAQLPVEDKRWTVLGNYEVLFKGRPSNPKPQKSPSMPWYRDEYGPSTAFGADDFVPMECIIAMLLESGVDPAALDDNTYTALDLALETGCIELIGYFAARPERLEMAIVKAQGDPDDFPQKLRAQSALMRPTPSFQRISEDDLACQEILIAPHAYLKWLRPEDLDQIITRKADDLLWMYQVGAKIVKLGAIEYFKACPALQCWVQDSGDKTVLQRAMQLQFENDKYYSGRLPTPALHLVCTRHDSSLQLLRLFVESCHVPINACSRDVKRYGVSPEAGAGGTALHALAHANSWWHLEAIRYLVSKGANVNATDEAGRTPLHVAAKGVYDPSKAGFGGQRRLIGIWRAEAVTLLLDLGADPNVTDKEGHSPLHKASNAPEILQELFERGARIEAGKVSPIFKVSVLHYFAGSYVEAPQGSIC